MKSGGLRLRSRLRVHGWIWAHIRIRLRGCGQEKILLKKVPQGLPSLLFFTGQPIPKKATDLEICMEPSKEHDAHPHEKTTYSHPRQRHPIKGPKAKVEHDKLVAIVAGKEQNEGHRNPRRQNPGQPGQRRSRSEAPSPAASTGIRRSPRKVDPVVSVSITCTQAPISTS